MSGALAELAVERSVRDQLYGEPVGVTVIPTEHPRGARGPDPRIAGPLGRVVGGRYRLLERLGSGGMASVYRALDERLKRDVAVKVIAERLARDPTFVRRLRREAQLSARLAHPGIVAILDVGVEPWDFIVMELVDGLDAGTLLLSEGPLTPGETVHVIAQVCEALSYAHDHDVVHHDVSPRNILIRRPDYTAKLADFGLASDVLDVSPRRETGATGTPGFAAPEILWGAGPSPRSDLYSLAVVAYRLLDGPARSRPSDSDATAPMATATPRLRPLAEARPDLPGRLTASIQQALSDDPDARQASVAEFGAELVAAVRASRRPRREMPAARDDLRSAA